MGPRFNKVEGEPYVPSVRFTGFGQKVVGTYVKRREREGRFGREIVADIRDEGGDIKAVVLTQDLIAKMAKVSIGSMVRITYVQDLDVGQRSPMRIFDVEAAEADNEPGDDLAPEPEDGSTPF